MSDNPRRPKSTSPGRPRSDETTNAIMQAALSLGEENGFAGLSIEGVAARAGVAKTTIYRRWPNVWSIVTDAFLADLTRLAPIQTRATTRESIIASMQLLARAYNGRLGRIIRPLLGQAQLDPALKKVIRDRWVIPRRQAALAIIQAGISRGEIRSDIPPDAILDALYGPFYHRLLLPYDEGESISVGYVDAIVEAVFGGIADFKNGRRT
ncbi:MAG: transcriptional regulator [Schlesneria sp.]|nr:transcriptional regulator [Schlesneria sp.]